MSQHEMLFEGLAGHVTAEVAVIKDQSFPISSIDEVRVYDDAPKASAWAKVGGALTVGGAFIALIAGRAPGISLILLIAGGALLVFKAFPSAGITMIISLTDGRSESIVGIPRQDVYEIKQAIEQAKSLSQHKLPA